MLRVIEYFTKSLKISYLMVNNIVTMQPVLAITQGHSNWYHSKAWVLFPIRL